MAIKQYSVTLEEDVVIRAKKIIDDNSQKLSPILNHLLEDWCESEEAKEEEGNGN